MTDGHDELSGKHERPAARGDEKASGGDKAAMAAPPVAAPQPAEAEPDVRPRVLLLGSGELSRELAVALQGLGAEVIAADKYADAPAHRVADKALVVTMTDAEELAAVFARLRPDLPDFVVTLTDAVCVDVLDALDASEARGSESEGRYPELVPSARSVRLTSDREGLRKLAADELGLPTAPFWFVGSLGELEAVAAHAGYPLLVKPVVKAAGRERSVVRGPDEIEHAWQRAVGGPVGQPPRVWAETVVDVEFLVTVIVVHSDGPAGPVIEFCAPVGHRGANGGDLESWQPQQMSSAAFDAAKSIAARVVKALGGRGVFGVELMVNGDEVYFADVTAWPGDSAWVTLRSQRLSAFELQARTILGLAVDTLMVSPGAARVIGPGQAPADAAPGPDALTAALDVPESDVRLFGRARAGAPRKVGVALATAPDVATARDRARDVATRLSMRDSRG
ncbi:phosphoribosylglycinamide formyltransferase 2 [Mycobacterium kansasii]|uniref:Phosphoribosylglycinamide formyltransferase 2 n=4 Tax=Mycobacterium kansasii TaxID=1768 RepID=A0A653EYU6_MYCKA|nr:phosphoribosylglycinamide formyltransferase [Mycobacterium kansasii ATCC 12478]ARG56378.1 phosphoribosylglycinamide formyltransferase 2 [Mycobacterium kansasii]ARG61829.1 phosphoribosylglycinamide formyltransferase 2 [Mycobacterium kansasii]ARG69516.1 phosphoribosylglycinamide formyltransferase 2 [Mycobacterium kansasii]ARG75867.1 phosphoribosylglycinamide formyltransferase 2 [Mycobacterium kansasii]